VKQIIHVNQHVIKSNRKNNTNQPVLTSKNYRNNVYCHEIELEVGGKIIGKFKYSKDKPLSCGAHVWFECDSEEVKLLHKLEG
jgi:hypothetical protein